MNSARLMFYYSIERRRIAPVFNKQIVVCIFFTFISTAFGETNNRWTHIVQAHLDIYSVLADRRDANENAILKSDTLLIKYRKDIRPLSKAKKEAFLCEATKWFILGRLAESKGLSKLIEHESNVESAKFVVYAVDTSVTPNRRGKYDQKRKLSPQLVLTIDRNRLKKLSLSSLRENLKGQNCSRVARAILTRVWFAN